MKFDRPLTFGDKEQIETIRAEERRQEWKAIKECDHCMGKGVEMVEADCENCDCNRLQNDTG